jgi:hypothetical protein
MYSFCCHDSEKNGIDDWHERRVNEENAIPMLNISEFQYSFTITILPEIVDFDHTLKCESLCINMIIPIDTSTHKHDIQELLTDKSIKKNRMKKKYVFYSKELFT